MTSNTDPYVDTTAELPTLEGGAPDARVTAESRSAELERELAQLQAEHAFQLDEHARARAHFEEQLAQARTLLSASGTRADELQRRMTELEGAVQLQRDHHEQHQQEVEQGRARAAGVLGDLYHERERRLALVEALQSAESRRAILGELVSDLQREGEERERELARAARALVGRDAHARELEAELAQRAKRITRLEQQVSSLTGSASDREAQLRRSRQQSRSLQTEAAEYSGSDSRQEGELERLRAERAELAAALEAARAATLAAAARTSGNEGTLTQLRSRNAELEAALSAERQRLGQLEGERAKARGEEQGTTHPPGLAAAEARVKELEERADEQQDAMRLLQSEASASVARARELEADLHAAEEAVHRLESEARGRNARLEERERADVRTRAAETVARHAPRESAAAPSEADAARAPGSAAAAAEPAPEGGARLLIRSEGGREIVHVLSRRTSIGRTPDNDLQIDAQFISRRHAVILVGPAHAIIEDLNSTNGVQVNGRRVTRQILKDGDTVQIGRLQYRFVVRKSGSEKR